MAHTDSHLPLLDGVQCSNCGLETDGALLCYSCTSKTKLATISAWVPPPGPQNTDCNTSNCVQCGKIKHATELVGNGGVCNKCL